MLNFLRRKKKNNEEIEEEINEEDSESIYRKFEEAKAKEELITKAKTEQEKMVKNAVGKKKVEKPIELPDTTYLIKELPFFRWEWIPYLFATMILVFVFIGDLILILISEDGIQLIHVLLMIVPAFLAIFLMWIMYLIKSTFYMPTGKKILVGEVLKGGAVYLRTIVPPSDNLVYLKSKRREDQSAPVTVTQMRKHFELCSNKPFVFLPEGWAQNISIFNLLKKIPMQFDSNELDTVMRKIKNTAVIMTEERLMGVKHKLKEPLFLAIVASIIMLLIMFLFLLALNGQVQAIAETLVGIQESIAAIPAG